MKHFLVPLLIALTLSACNAPTASQPILSPTNTIPPPPAETPTAQPTPTPTQAVLEVTTPDPANVVLDFVAAMCTAQWSNNGEYLLCPGDPNDTGAGYVARLDSTLISGDLLVNAPTLLTIPAYERLLGIFGHYPAIQVWSGDSFHAILACKPAAIPCNVKYALSYFDSNGAFHDLAPQIGPLPIAEHDAARGVYTEVEIDLSSLAGQNVEFVLTVRTEGDQTLYNPLWIAPRIERDPNAQPPDPVVIATATPSSASEGVPGTISGMVDMSSAPPYLKDSYTGGEASVVVMFFNLDDNTWWWIHSTPTHPYYRMTVPPGNYHVVAYAKGVGDVPYVTGGYTGSNPSCGQALQTVNVPSSGNVENIVIADWNWSCGGDAYRPAKPASVPIP